MDVVNEIANEVMIAQNRLRGRVRESYLEHSPYLSQLGNASVYLKLENLQHTGSFKVRGAFNKLLSLSDGQRLKGCVAASTGNHGAAVAYGMRKLHIDGHIFVPDNASPGKVRAIQEQGGLVKHFGSDSAATEAYARAFAAERGMIYISPYNDIQVIGGQGTIAFEIHRQLGHVDVVVASLGGGGLISGIGGYLKLVLPQAKLLACSPENSQVMIQSVKSNKVLDLPSLPTLSDGTAGGVEPGAITLDYCRELVDEYDTVTEDEIADAVKLIIESHHMLIEGAAGVAVASYLKSREIYAGKNVVIVICGGNLDLDKLRGILDRSDIA